MTQNILVVEDDEVIALLVEYLLTREGYQVILAKDGYEALQRIESNIAVDLVLLDVMLPYVDGTHLLERIRGIKEWGNIPIIMLTAKSSEKDIASALNLGADDYISKPFKPLELIARIKHRLKQRK